MNLFDGKFDLIDSYPLSENKHKIQGNYTDNTGTYTSYDAQVGDIIYVDGSFLGLPLLRYKIIELHTEEYYDSVISATVEWDMIEGIELAEPFGGMEGIIGALHSNGLTANITTTSVNAVNEVLIARAQSYQTMLLGLNSGGEVAPPIIIEVNKKIEALENKIGSVQLEWEDLNRLSFI